MTNSTRPTVQLRITILIRIRPGILDPQGQAVCQALHDSGANEVSSVRIGKLVEIVIPDAPYEDFAAMAKQFCDSLLANPLTEEYEILSIVPIPPAGQGAGTR